VEMRAVQTAGVGEKEALRFSGGGGEGSGEVGLDEGKRDGAGMSEVFS
jgi:hypothetical protein